MRLSGLASGMDTDSMIKEMMKTERIKVDKLTQDKQILSWRQETFNSLNKDLVNFILDSKKKLGVKTSYSGAVSYRDINWSKTATLNTDAKSTATASPSAMDGKHTINVTRMAEGVTAVSSGDITTGTKNDVISNQFTGFGEKDIIEFKIKGKNANEWVTFKIGDDGAGTNKVSDPTDVDVKGNIVRITKKLSEVSLSEIVTKINNATVYGSEVSKPLGMKASYDSNLDRFFIQTRDTGSDATMKFDATLGSKGSQFLAALNLNLSTSSLKDSSAWVDGTKYDGNDIVAKSKDLTVSPYQPPTADFTITITDGSGKPKDVKILVADNLNTIQDLVGKIGGSASFMNGFLSIKGGSSLKISGSDDNARNFIGNLGLTVSDASGEKMTERQAVKINTDYNGINAKIDYSVDGVPIKSGMEQSSNSFSINGINFNAQAVEKADITIGTNTDEVYNKVKEFIEGYNKIVDNMNSLVSEKTYRSFKPLTSEQKEAMSEEEVKLWEVKARSGLVKGDEIISRTIQTVRSGLYDVVDGATGSYNHITQIGITTEKFVSGASGGRLEINESKLKEAIAKDANGVLDLLFKSPEGSLDTDDDNLTIDNLKLKREQSGIVTRIYHNLAAGMKSIVEKSGIGQEGNLLREVRARITQDFATKHSSRSLIDKSIFDYDKRINTMNSYLSNREQFYYNKFTAMEKAMQNSNAQSSWLTQQLGGGQ